MPDSQVKVIDRLLLGIIIFMLALVAVLDTRGNQHIEDTVEQTNLIAQCIQPESDCAKLTSERDKREREYLQGLMKTTNICVVYATRTAAGRPIDVVIQAYDACVEAGAPPPPAPVTRNEVN